VSLIRLAEIGCYIAAPSASQVAIGGGSASFVLANDYRFPVGTAVTATAQTLTSVASATGLTVQLGTCSLVLAADTPFPVGSGVTLTDTAYGSNALAGSVVSYSGLTLVVAVTTIAGSGNYTAWSVSGNLNTLSGLVTAYDPSSYTLTVAVTGATGAGSYAAWVIGGAVTWLFCTGRGFAAPDGPGFYDPAMILTDGGVDTVFGDLKTFGLVQTSVGAIKVGNIDGRRDHLRRYAWRGWTARELLVDEAGSYASAVAIRAGTIEQPVGSVSDILFRWRDCSELLQKPVQPTKYSGTNNVITNGVEGLQTDIYGQYKPFLRGYAYNFSPILVNVGLATYQISAGRIDGITAVCDGGVPIGAGVAHTSLAALQAATVATGRYDWYFGIDGSYFRLGSLPARGVTCSAYEGALRTTAQIVLRILTLDAGFAASSVSAADVAALDAVAPWENGVWVDTGGATQLDAINAVLPGAAAWLATDQAAVWRLGQISAPAGPSVLTLKRVVTATDTLAAGEYGYISLDLVANTDPGRGVPAQEVVVSYGKNYTVQAEGTLGGDKTSPTDPVGGLGVRYRLANQCLDAINAATIPTAQKIQWPVENDLQWECNLRNTADAIALANHLATIYGVLRDTCQIEYKPDQTSIVAARLGAVITVVSPRFGLAAGKLMLVIGVQHTDHHTVVLTAWGATPS